MEQEQARFGQEVGAGLERDELPGYAPMLAAFHRACAGSLESIVGEVPVAPGARVLDMACGDGVYAAWLAQRVGSGGHVVGVDIAPAYLEVARRHVAERGLADGVSFEIGDIAGLPFADGEFDLAWCAHSLYSLPDPLAALRELKRVVRPGGTVAILENDSLHHWLLPWPAELELAVRQAHLDALRSEANSGKFFIGRNLCRAFSIVGLQACHVRTRTIDHRAPLTADERLFIQSYLDDLGERARPHLEPAARDAFDKLLDPGSELYLLEQPDFFAAHLEILAWAVRQD